MHISFTHLQSVILVLRDTLVRTSKAIPLLQTQAGIQVKGGVYRIWML